MSSSPPKSRKGMLKITEIFHSLQGEALQAGLPTVFVRLTGCPLRCTYCDSEYAFYGGEPLAQKRCAEFLKLLCDRGYAVSLETSGAMDISQADRRVIRVMDLKTPASREESSNLWPNLEELTHHDQIKFVICSRQDYEWAREQVAGRDLGRYCEVLFSPAWGMIEPVELAEWILQDRLPVRYQLQLHKLLWGDQPGK